MGQVPVLHVALDNVVAAEQAPHVLYQGNNPDSLGEELANPVLDRLAVQQGLVFLADHHLPVIGLYKGDLFSRGREGKDYLLQRRYRVPAVEALGRVPGGGQAMERLHGGLPHVAFRPRISHAQGHGHVAPQVKFILEDLGVAGEKLAHHLGVRFLALRVPHLLVTAQAEHVDGLGHFPVALHHSRLVGEGGRRSVVRVLGAHRPGY